MSSARKRKAPQFRRNPSLGGDQGVSKVRAKLIGPEANGAIHLHILKILIGWGCISSY